MLSSQLGQLDLDGDRPHVRGSRFARIRTAAFGCVVVVLPFSFLLPFFTHNHSLSPCPLRRPPAANARLDYPAGARALPPSRSVPGSALHKGERSVYLPRGAGQPVRAYSSRSTWGIQLTPSPPQDRPFTFNSYQQRPISIYSWRERDSTSSGAGH